MEQNVCNTCLYYRRHYSFDQRKIFQVHCGHCAGRKIRRKRPDAKACDDYVRSDPEENAFVSKEYLSKELLEYMMRLELLPEIQKSEKG